jgi:hypothetical protein
MPAEVLRAGDDFQRKVKLVDRFPFLPPEMNRAATLRVIQHCRTGSRSSVVLVLDEAVKASLIGVHESRALSEAAKWGLEVHLLTQNPLGFPSAEIQSNVLQNCWRHEWFRQGSPDPSRRRGSGGPPGR